MEGIKDTTFHQQTNQPTARPTICWLQYTIPPSFIDWGYKTN